MNLSSPKNLNDLQHWFGNIISQPIKKNNKLPSELSQEASLYILPGPVLKPLDRLEIYHQQYWWRVIEILQQNFPSLTRIFGYEDFNIKIAIPYLSKHPSTHFSLAFLGSTLSDWIESHYHDDDKNIVHAISCIDWAVHSCFWTEDSVNNNPISLASHIHLLTFEADYVTFRSELLKNEVEYFNNNPFPSLEHQFCHYIIYRSAENSPTFEKLTQGKYMLLEALQKGLNLEEACQKLESEEEIFLEAEKNISFWFYEWTKRKWIISY